MKIYPSIDSTNKEAARLLQAGGQLHGTSLLAHHQSDGLGQYGRRWHSEAGLHLAMSIILQPADMGVHELPQLSMRTSLAVVRVIHELELSISPFIKWPNDIYAEGKKLAGILIENSLSGSRVQHCIIGLGMNVNETYFPESIPNAVSLTMLTGKIFEIETIAERILHHVLTIIDEPISKWKKEYRNNMFGLEKKQKFEKEGKKIEAKVMDVDPQGRLIVEYNGKNEAHLSHQLKWIL
ncbi:MAG TPA: biotin--[acetyl-CoA-carboxylase] ligase [Saprospiraceae bacterium]|nr:biotin--[acetyl-CoA-carboxylase] ligase [Saprospiraceae bacterium]